MVLYVRRKLFNFCYKRFKNTKNDVILYLVITATHQVIHLLYAIVCIVCVGCDWLHWLSLVVIICLKCLDCIVCDHCGVCDDWICCMSWLLALIRKKSWDTFVLLSFYVYKNW